MLKYGHNEKMTFCAFIGREQQKLFWGIILFIRRVPPSNFVVVTFLLTSLRKGYFLRRRLKRYRLLMEKIAVLMVFDIRLQMMYGYMFSSIMLTFFTEMSPLRTPVPLQMNMWATMVNAMHHCHSNFNLLYSFSIHPDLSTKYWLLPKTFVALAFTMPRNASELKFLHCKESMDISHNIFYAFYGEKELLTECSIVWRVVFNQYRHCMRG